MAVVNRLSRAEMRAVEDWLLENRLAVESGQWTQATVAAKLSKQLERPVLHTNVAGAARAVGVKFVRSKADFKSKEGIKILARELLQLYEKYNFEVSDDLRTLAG